MPCVCHHLKDCICDLTLVCVLLQPVEIERAAARVGDADEAACDTAGPAADAGAEPRDGTEGGAAECQ